MLDALSFDLFDITSWFCMSPLPLSYRHHAASPIFRPARPVFLGPLAHTLWSVGTLFDRYRQALGVCWCASSAPVPGQVLELYEPFKFLLVEEEHMTSFFEARRNLFSLSLSSSGS